MEDSEGKTSNKADGNAEAGVFHKLDGGDGFGRVGSMQSGSFYFRNGFAGWFYFSPSSWRVRLR